MDSAVLNPFRPGADEAPPVLAGRDRERLELGGRLARIKADQPGGFVAMYGPRGNGKTVLLAELRGLAVKEGVRVLTLAPLEPEDRNPKNPWQIMELFAPPVETTTTFQSGVPGMASESESTKSVSMPPSIGNLLSLAKNGPVLLAVDDAHMLPVGFGRSVLHTAQTCISYGYPVMCVFAGTPGLRENFRAMHASFWERSKRIRIGRLDTDAAVCEALAAPATNSGLSFGDDALDLLMGEAQRYPNTV